MDEAIYRRRMLQLQLIQVQREGLEKARSLPPDQARMYVEQLNAFIRMKMTQIARTM